MTLKLFFIQLLLFPAYLISQETNTESPPPPDYIKTITFSGSQPEGQLPIVNLGAPITLEFDALTGHEADYYYRIKHFNFDWTPSVLARLEYMDGFDNQRIRVYENSVNTYQVYSRYKLSIPNNQTRALKVSGNYQIQIFDDSDTLLFSRKFMVYESLTQVGLQIKRTRNGAAIAKKQRVEIRVVPKGAPLNNPQETVKILLVQNNNLHTAITTLKPQYTIGKQLIYKYDLEASFWGGNEYLFFENKDIRAGKTGVDRVLLKDRYHNYLFTNEARASSIYTYNPDINGDYRITCIDCDNPDLEADYAWIHFSLVPEERFEGKTIYVYGNFNNYALEATNKMTWDEKTGLYRAEILLKQGFYNYKYVGVNPDGSLDEGLVSGNFYQTENNYKALVYYRNLGGRYDRIIGLGTGNSEHISN